MFMLTIRINNECIEQHFPNFNVHPDHLGSMLNVTSPDLSGSGGIRDSAFPTVFSIMPKLPVQRPHFE